ncbi:MAG: hypothetical protein ACFFG0_17180 [Candidatus Thorarchaeota archaeon]
MRDKIYKYRLIKNCNDISMDFVKELEKYLKKELEKRNYSVTLVKNTKIKHFFGSEIVGNIAYISFNPRGLVKLKTSNIKKEVIEQSARYFAQHEYRHWKPRFQIFNSPEFTIPNPVEENLMIEDSHGNTYFPYNENNLIRKLK